MSCLCRGKKTPINVYRLRIRVLTNKLCVFSVPLLIGIEGTDDPTEAGAQRFLYRYRTRLAAAPRH